MKEPERIPASEWYDQEDDIYYVSFKTGEPSQVIEIDDILLLEVGIFTNMPTGFRILNFKKHKAIRYDIIYGKIRKAMEDTAKNQESVLKARETQVGRTLEKVLAS